MTNTTTLPEGYEIEVSQVGPDQWGWVLTRYGKRVSWHTLDAASLSSKEAAQEAASRAANTFAAFISAGVPLDD